MAAHQRHQRISPASRSLRRRQASQQSYPRRKLPVWLQRFPKLSGRFTDLTGVFMWPSCSATRIRFAEQNDHKRPLDDGGQISPAEAVTRTNKMRSVFHPSHFTFPPFPMAGTPSFPLRHSLCGAPQLSTFSSQLSSAASPFLIAHRSCLIARAFPSLLSTARHLLLSCPPNACPTDGLSNRPTEAPILPP